MANTVGSLRVLLGLDAAEFTRGLSKAEYQTQQFSRNVRSAIADVGAALATLDLGKQFIESTKAIISEASALNDLADATGSSVESLSRLNNQAKIAGADFSTLQNAVLKLSQGMAGADEESTKAKEALRILGVTAKDPVEALQQVALKLNTYADGVNKVGLAVALFGKQGGQFVATLKDIAELQDVGATVSTKQAAAAEDLEKAFRRLSYESKNFKDAILNDVVPALLKVITTFNDARAASGSFGVALDTVLSLGARSGGAEQKLAAVNAEIAKTRESLAKPFGPFKGLQELNEVIKTEQLTRLTAQRDTLEAQLRRGNRSQIARDVEGVFGKKPDAPNPPSSGGSKAARERESEAERYIKALSSQLERARDLTAAEEVLREVQIGRLQDATPKQIEQAYAMAQELEAIKAAKTEEQDYQKLKEQTARDLEKYAEAHLRTVDSIQRERDSILQSNEQAREQLILLRDGQAALDKYTAAKREALAVQKETEAAQKAAQGFEDEAKALREVAAALRETTALAGDLRLAEKLKAESEAIEKLKSDAFDIVGNSLEDLIVNGAKASDVLKRLEKDLISFITKQALAGLKDGLFGSGGSGGAGNLFSIIAGFLGGGGAGSGAGGISSGGLAGFASGGVSRGGLAMVGENGPELVNLSHGDRVYNNRDTKGLLGNSSSLNITQHINVMPGADTRSGRQAARDAGMAVQRAVERR